MTVNRRRLPAPRREISALQREDPVATSGSGHWAGLWRRVADAAAGPAACKGQVQRQTRQPSRRPAKVRNRRPQTFTGKLRRAAGSLGLSLSPAQREAARPRLYDVTPWPWSTALIMDVPALAAASRWRPAYRCAPQRQRQGGYQRPAHERELDERFQQGRESHAHADTSQRGAASSQASAICRALNRCSALSTSAVSPQATRSRASSSTCSKCSRTC